MIISYLQKDEKLKDSPERRWKQPGVSHCHLEEEGVKKSVSYIDQWVLVDVRISHPVHPTVVIKWDVIV